MLPSPRPFAPPWTIEELDAGVVALMPLPSASPAAIRLGRGGSTPSGHSSARSLSAGRSIVIGLFGSCSCPHSLGAARHQLSCAKPQIESRAETTRATHDTFMDMLFGPITT